MMWSASWSVFGPTRVRRRGLYRSPLCRSGDTHNRTAAGQNSSYINALREVDSEKFAVSICSVDGTVASLLCIATYSTKVKAKFSTSGTRMTASVFSLATPPSHMLWLWRNTELKRCGQRSAVLLVVDSVTCRYTPMWELNLPSVTSTSSNCWYACLCYACAV